MKLRFILHVSLFLIAVGCSAGASGPRWVAGSPYFYVPGWLVYWYSDTVLYFTDPGDLSQYVSHSAADAIVDAAASVWNVPSARITIARGGALDEDVSSSNVYASTSGIVFPADVQAANYAAKQIAVIYDRDGAVTDMLLGSGASAPSSCRQNAVTESVDSIVNNGQILHALLVLNGRCTGPAPEQQLQLQYQLTRAFGRVLGLSWSQTNDNIFTGNPLPTYQQSLYWPVMHPIDVICGPYTYQCMPSPFTLRDDDISGLTTLYPNPQNYTHPPGKVDTFATANRVEGTLSFPGGQGMQGVNVVVHRLEPFWDTPEAWESASSVSGYLFRRRDGNAVSGPLSGPPTIGMGSTDPSYEGCFNINRIPLYDWETWQNLVISTQPVNPLYVGSYAVGPYDISSVAPSGSSKTQTAGVISNYGVVEFDGGIADAAATCSNAADGTEASPAAVPATGWWNGDLCTYGHAAWLGLTVRPGRSFTFEVTALDEQGVASTTKMLPVTGVWNASDSNGTLPTVAAAPGAFNSTVNAMTTLSASPTGSADRPLRIVIADQRGDGRPDYNYQARLLYAVTLSPANVPAYGGAVIITGMGFRAGNAVTVNGMPATVTGWTANSITLLAPASQAAGAVSADVMVRDLTTGATSSMTGALQYSAPQPALTLVSAPTGQVFTGSASSTPFSVKAIAADGVTPIAGVRVNFSVTSGSARFSCGSSTCSVFTDTHGIASSSVTPLSTGAMQLSATSSVGSVSANFTAVDQIQTVTALTAQLYVAAGSHVAWSPQVKLSDNGGSTVGVPVLWTAAMDGISFFPSISATDGSSIATTNAEIGPLDAETVVSSMVCAWSSVCSAITVSAVGDDRWRLQPVSGAVQSVSSGTPFGLVTVRVVDDQGHAIAGAPVSIYQTLEPYSAPCDPLGRCPVAPVYLTSASDSVSALDGTITFMPLDVAGQPVVTRIAVASGKQGFSSLTLVRVP